MTKNQKDIVDVYSGFCVAMFIIAVLWGILYKVYMGIQKFYYGKSSCKHIWLVYIIFLLLTFTEKRMLFILDI